MKANDLDQQIRLILARLELISTAPTQAFNPGGGRTDAGDSGLAGPTKTPADHFRVRLAGVQTGLRRRLDAAEATGDHEQRAAEERKAHRIAHEQRERILIDAQREWRQLTGRNGEAPEVRITPMDTKEGVQAAAKEDAPGKPSDVIARQFGVTEFTARRWYVKWKLDPEDGSKLTDGPDDAALTERAQEMARRGMTQKQIGMRLDIHQGTVSRLLRKSAA